MPYSIFNRKSSIASRSSRICQEEYTLLTKALKDVVRRLVICYKSLCCFPLDQILPPKQRKVRNGLNLHLKPAPFRVSQKVLPEIKLIHILPRSRVSFNEPARVQSPLIPEIRAKSEIIPEIRVKSEITTVQVKSEIVTTAKHVKSNVFNRKEVKSKVSFEKQINSVVIDKVKATKISKTRMIKEKSRKIFDYGSGSIRSTFKHRKKSSGSFIMKDKKKSKSNDRNENKWLKTKRMIKISNPSNIKWMKHTKPRRNLTVSSTDNEESAGDGPVTPILSGNKEMPLRWNLLQEQGLSDTDVEFIKKDIDQEVTLEII